MELLAIAAGALIGTLLAFTIIAAVELREYKKQYANYRHD